MSRKVARRRTTCSVEMYQREYDPNAMVQTGPGLPRWHWNRAVLHFSGSVERLRAARVPDSADGKPDPPSGAGGAALLLALRISGAGEGLMGLWRRDGRSLPVGGSPLIALIVALSLVAPTLARAELPSQELLDTLSERLLAKPSCHPKCASSSRLQLEIKRNFLRLRMEIGAAAATAVPLPGAPISGRLSRSFSTENRRRPWPAAKMVTCG